MNFRYTPQNLIEIWREVLEFKLVDRQPCRFEFISRTCTKKLNSFVQILCFWTLSIFLFIPDKDRITGIIQKHNIFINVPSSQTFRSYLNSFALNTN
jgi:hypothetical protein